MEWDSSQWSFGACRDHSLGVYCVELIGSEASHQMCWFYGLLRGVLVQVKISHYLYLVWSYLEEATKQFMVGRYLC